MEMSHDEIKKKLAEFDAGIPGKNGHSNHHLVWDDADYLLLEPKDGVVEHEGQRWKVQAWNSHDPACLNGAKFVFRVFERFLMLWGAAEDWEHRYEKGYERSLSPHRVPKDTGVTTISHEPYLFWQRIPDDEQV
jgi:hypothetical protein